MNGARVLGHNAPHAPPASRNAPLSLQQEGLMLSTTTVGVFFSRSQCTLELLELLENPRVCADVRGSCVTRSSSHPCALSSRQRETNCEGTALKSARGRASTEISLSSPALDDVTTFPSDGRKSVNSASVCIMKCHRHLDGKLESAQRLRGPPIVKNN